MKQIQFYNAEKYQGSDFKRVSDFTFRHGEYFVTSISFVQEPDYGEGTFADDISQYPLEDILDQFCVFVSDTYPQKNTANSRICYLEFSGKKLKNINELLSIIGHHVVNKTVIVNGKSYIDLIIE